MSDRKSSSGRTLTAAQEHSDELDRLRTACAAYEKDSADLTAANGDLSTDFAAFAKIVRSFARDLDVARGQFEGHSDVVSFLATLQQSPAVRGPQPLSASSASPMRPVLPAVRTPSPATTAGPASRITNSAPRPPIPTPTVKRPPSPRTSPRASPKLSPSQPVGRRPPSPAGSRPARNGKAIAVPMPQRARTTSSTTSTSPSALRFGF